MKDYRVFKEIGAGAFGRVMLVEKPGSNEKFCIKQIDVAKMSKKEQDSAVKEAKMLKKFDHPNIVRYEDFFLDAGKLCIVMELAEDGDLYARVKQQNGRRFPEQQVLNWFVQVRRSAQNAMLGRLGGAREGQDAAGCGPTINSELLV